jgi:hypothetical protein
MVIDKKVVGFARDCHPPKYRPFRSYEVFQLPSDWAKVLFDSNRHVCDLTPKALFGPFGGPSVPRSSLRHHLPLVPMPDWTLRLYITGAVSESTALRRPKSAEVPR